MYSWRLFFRYGDGTPTLNGDVTIYRFDFNGTWVEDADC